MTFQIRRLRQHDETHMFALLDCMQAAFEDADTYGAKRPDKAYLHSLLSSADFIALVALSNNKVIGGLTAYTLHKYEQQRSEVYIYDLAVSQAFRRNGAATALINYLKPIAKQAGAWVIFVQADIGDVPPISLYSKLGVKEDVLHFDIPVE